MKSLRELLTQLEHTSTKVATYEGSVADAAFDLQTFDTFIAGVAMQVLEARNLGPDERNILEQALPLRGTTWQLDSGEEVELDGFPELLAHARLVEAVRLAGLKRIGN